MSASFSDKPARFNLKIRVLRSIALLAWVFVAFILVQVLVGAGVEVLENFGWKFAQLDRAVLVFSLSVIIYGLALLLTVGMPVRLKLWSGQLPLKKLLGIDKPLRWRDVGMAALGFVAYLALAFWITQLVAFVFPSFNINQAQNIGIKSLSGNIEFVLALITFVGLAPLAEELLFRGYLFGNLRRIVSFNTAAVLTSALFGLVHFQWNVSIDVFVLSLALCYLREHSGRLWPAVLVHMGKNLLAFAILFIFHAS